MRGENAMCFSDRLKELRIKEDLSQEDLAEKLNIPRTTISHYENDPERLPRRDRLYEIADFFGVNVEYLLGRSDVVDYTDDEKDFLSDSNRLTVKELSEKYELTIDGKPATKEEIKGAVAFIRSLRSME